MADKLTQLIIDALSRAAADPAGLPLFAGKTEPGLFPASSAARPAAQKCLADGLVRVARTEAKGKTAREFYGLTDKGWDFLLAAVNPRQVLEDFVRVLEARQGEVGELLDTARQMAASLQGLKDAVTRVLPQVSAGRLIRPLPPAPSHGSDGSEERGCEEILRRRQSLFPFPPGGEDRPANGTAVRETPGAVEAHKADVLPDLAAAVLARLSDWAASANAGEDCPLPELFRGLTREPRPTIGEFHDCLRQLHAAGAVYLHPWTGPLYALPEPAYALLAGHNVAYYASPRSGPPRAPARG